jgi:hypothetical protein
LTRHDTVIALSDITKKLLLVAAAVELAGLAEHYRFTSRESCSTILPCNRLLKNSLSARFSGRLTDIS